MNYYFKERKGKKQEKKEEKEAEGKGKVMKIRIMKMTRKLNKDDEPEENTRKMREGCNKKA